MSKQTIEIRSWTTGDVLTTQAVPAELSLPKALGRAVLQALREGVCLTWAKLTGAKLTGAKLTWAKLTGAKLTGADLAWADITGANLTGARLARTDFRQANFADAIGLSRLIDGGLLSDGYRVFLWWDEERGWRIRGGCQDLAWSEAREWNRTDDGRTESLRRETEAMLYHLERLAALRGLDLSETV